MDRESIEEVLRIINDTNEQFMVINGWVSCSCPFAPWKHASGRDSRPSFGVKVDDVGTSYANCFTCHTSGTLADVLIELQEISGEDYADLIDEVYDGEVLGGHLPSWDNLKKKNNTQAAIPDPPDIAYLDMYDELYDGHWYLEDRGISADVAVDLDLRVDPDDKGYERILFPVYTHTGVFYGYTGRRTDDSDAVDCIRHPKVRDYFGLPKKFLLLGAELLSKKDEFIVVVEGLFDYASCYMFGYPSVATLGAGTTEPKISILKQLNKPIVLMQDNDKAGREGNCKIATLMHRHVPVYGVDYPDGVNDPGTLTGRQMHNMIEDMELLTNLKSIAEFYGYTTRNGKIFM